MWFARSLAAGHFFGSSALAVERYLIVGLGNPGERYQHTRHNAGFWVVDQLADDLGAEFRHNARLHADICEVSGPAGKRLLLAKPQTFMNASGKAVRALIDFYKLAADHVMVIHDELDLPTGRLRLKQAGGPGGHNGLKDIIRHCGPDFLRLRIGVGHPGRREAVLGHVLSKAGSAEQRALDEARLGGVQAVLAWLRDGWNPTVQQLHSSN